MNNTDNTEKVQEMVWEFQRLQHPPALVKGSYQMEIILKNVCKNIRKIPILCNISLELHSGIIYGLRGVNGSGKTMLMRLLAGLIRQTSGTISIDGKMLGKDISFPEDIGILIENPAFLDNYTGVENLRLLANIRGKVGEERLTEIINQVGLKPDDKRKYKQYSLGMKQRLGIAGAVLEHPSLLLIDEPTNALDSDGVEMVKQLVLEEKERGALIILACHDFSVLNYLSDEIFLVKEGSLSAYVQDEK